MTGWREQGTEKHTPAQLRMLNAVCGDLARQIIWHGVRMDKDDWRHFLSGTAAGWRAVPAYNNGDGKFGVVMLGGSSLKLSKTQASDAIEMGLEIGDNPSGQGISSAPVQWCDAVLLGLGFNPNDMRAA